MKRLLGFVLTLTLSLSSLAAHADDKVKQAARARYLEGVAQVKRSDWEGGYLSFKQAYSVIQLPDVLFNLSVCEMKTHRTLDALGHFRAYLADPSISAKDRALAQGHVASLEAETGRLRPRVGAGAEVTIDGKRVDYRAGGPAIDVGVGKHEVAVVYPDGAAKKTSVEVKAGETAEPELQPDPVPVASATTVSTATTTSPPGAHPPASPLTTTTRPPAGYIVPIAMGVVGLAGVGIGAGLAVQSQSLKDNALAAGKSGVCTVLTSAACASARDDGSSVSGMGGAAIGLYVVGGAIIVASAVTFLVWPKTIVQEKQAGLYFLPGIGSFTLGGTFQ